MDSAAVSPRSAGSNRPRSCWGLRDAADRRRLRRPVADRPHLDPAALRGGQRLVEPAAPPGDVRGVGQHQAEAVPLADLLEQPQGGPQRGRAGSKLPVASNSAAWQYSVAASPRRLPARRVAASPVLDGQPPVIEIPPGGEQCDAASAQVPGDLVQVQFGGLPHGGHDAPAASVSSQVSGS
jgi:hypothetical protein